MSADIESLVIAAVIETGDMTTVLDLGVRDEWFTGERSAKVWAWLRTYWAEHSAVPTEEAYERRFPTYELEITGDPLPALVEELRSSRAHGILVTALQTSISHLSTFDPTDRPEETRVVVAHLRESIASIDLDLTAAMFETLEETVDAYVEEIMTKEPLSVRGTRTGIDFVDRVIGGLMPGQFILLAGPPKSAKSTILLHAAMQAKYQGRRVMLVSYEMTNDEQKARVVSLGAHVDAAVVREGLSEMHPRQRDPIIKKLRAFVEEFTESDGELMLIHDNDPFVSAIEAKIEQLSPDIVYVDGLYLIHDEKGEPDNSAAALTNVSRALARMARVKDIPIYATTQVLEWKMKKGGGVTLNSIGYSSAMAQDAHVIIGIWREDHKETKSKMRVVAARNALGAEGEVEVDLGQGIIVDVTGDNESALGSRSSSGYMDDDDD